jgi:[acyl-carrier-protein] S-malonyltransferase
VLVIVGPGQGAQTPGFLQPWLELPGFAARMDWLSACAGIDLIKHGTESDADTIRDTAIAQPLIVGAGLVSLLALFPHPSDAFSQVGAGAGHSVGELTAAAASGVISAEQAMVLVRERGRAMAEAAAVTPTGMSAVLGGDPDQVAATAEAAGLTVANQNGAGQVVVGGTHEQLAALAEAPPEGARVRTLQVAGAFHTIHMQPAVARMGGLARAVSTHDPRIRLLSNRDGAVVHHGTEVLERIVAQIAQPVRWDLVMRTMADLGVTAVIEVPPAGTLTGLIKRALPGVETVALKSPDDLPAALDLVARHGAPADLDVTPSWRLLVAPAKGTFRLAPGSDVDESLGTELATGATVGAVHTLRDEHPVTAPHGGIVIEWLVEDGDPVNPGQPLLRLHPLEAEVAL